MRYSVPRKSRRVPLDVPVHLKLEELPDPVTQRLQNVSLGGVCVMIDRPSEVGSLVAFEFSIGDSLIEGTGEVTWTQPEPEGSGRPAAMGVRYRYLSPGSRERIFRLVQWYAAQKGDLTGNQVAEAASASLQPPSAPGRPPVVSAEPAAAAPAAAAKADPAATDTGTVRMPAVASRPVPPAAPPGAAETAESRASREAPLPLRGAAFGPSAGATASEASGQGPLDLPDLSSSSKAEGGSEAAETEASPAFPPAAPAPDAYAEIFPASDPSERASEEAPEAAGEPFGQAIGDEDEGVGEEDEEVREEAYAEGTAGEPAFPSAGPDAGRAPRMARASDYTTSYSHLRSAEEGTSVESSRRGLWIVLGAVILVGLLVLAFLFRGSLGFGGDEGTEAPATTEPAAEGAGQRSAASGTDFPPPADSRALTEGDATEDGAVDPGPAGEPPEEGPAAPDEPATAEEDDTAAGDASATASDGADPEPEPLRAPPLGAAATRVESITWNEQQGRTVVVIRGNGLLESTSISSLSPGTADAKLLIRIRGIEEGYSPRALSAGTPQLARVRTGLHAGGATPELHVVLDYAGAGVTLAGEVEAVGRELRVILTGS